MSTKIRWRGKLFRTFHDTDLLYTSSRNVVQLFWCFSHWPKAGGEGGGAEGLRRWWWGPPFQIAFLGQSLFLFSPACGQSHSEGSGPKGSWSIILILQCKQTGCILVMSRSDTEKSSLSATDKKKYGLGNRRLNPFSNCYKASKCSRQQRRVWLLSCYVLCKILQLPEKVVWGF